MEREFAFCVTDPIFKAKEDMTIHGNMKNSARYSEFKELIVHGNCVVEETLKADRLVIDGDLVAKTVIVNQLEVKGNVNASKICVDDIKIGGDLITVLLNAHYSTVTVKGKVKTNSISGEIVKLSVGDRK